VSAHNQRRLRARGAVEHGAREFPWLVGLHVAFPIALAAEVIAGARSPSWWPAALAALAAAEALRLWSMAALGEYWTARVLTLPAMPRLRRGPYRWFAHPSYAAAALELLAAPLLFGAWRTALALALLNGAALALRIRTETRELARVAGPPLSGR